MSERDKLLADTLTMIAAGALGIWAFSRIVWEPAIWALLPWLASGAYIVYRYRPQWFAWAIELFQRAQRFTGRLFAGGISQLIPRGNAQFGSERPAPKPVTLQFADVGQPVNCGHGPAKTGHWSRCWTGVIAFARALANFPILWVVAAVLFGLAWGAWNRFDGVREGRLEERALWQAAQEQAKIRGTQAQRGHDERSRDIGAVHEAAKQSTTRILARANEESERVDPTDLAALWAHHHSVMRELRDEADASAAAALEAYDRSIAS